MVRHHLYNLIEHLAGTGNRGLEKSLRRSGMLNKCHPSSNRDTACYDTIVTVNCHD